MTPQTREELDACLIERWGKRMWLYPVAATRKSCHMMREYLKAKGLSDEEIDQEVNRETNARALAL